MVTIGVRVGLIVLGWALFAAPAPAVTPRDELLRLVPEDVGFCLVVEDLRGQASAFLDSPFVKQFRASALGAKLLHAPEAQKLAELSRLLHEHLQIGPAKLRDEILGDAVVLAYRPGPPDKPELEEGLLLIRARNTELLAELVNRLNEAQMKSGDVRQLDEHDYQDQKYFRRVEPTGENYYYLRGPILAFSPREGILRQSIELDQTAPAEGEPPIARQLRLSGVTRPLAALWVNPRSFDRALERKAADAKGFDGVALTALLRYWKPLDGIAFSLTLQKDLEMSLAVRARTRELPPAAQRFLSAAAERSQLWNCFPDNAILAVAGRFDLAAFVEMISEFIPEEIRKPLRAQLEGKLGGILRKGIVRELLPQIGPDWGLCVAAPPADSKAWVPQVWAVLRARPGESGTPTDLALLDALNFFANLAVFTHNSGRPGQLIVKSVTQGKVEVRYLDNPEEFPPGFQPAYALKDGYLVIGSSPEAIKRFQLGSSPGTPRAATSEVPLVRLSLRELGNYVKEQRTPLGLFCATTHQIPAEEAGRRLDGLLDALALFDRVEVNQAGPTGRLTLTLRVQTSQPLK
jgi:hypothetical protein